MAFILSNTAEAEASSPEYPPSAHSNTPGDHEYSSAVEGKRAMVKRGIRPLGVLRVSDVGHLPRQGFHQMHITQLPGVVGGLIASTR